MFIWNDTSYIKGDMFAVEHGFAKVDVHSLRLSACNGETIYERMDGEKLLRGYSRSITRDEMARRVKAVCDALNERFKIYQYDDDGDTLYNSKYDLFFWCNDKYNTTGGKETGRDMSYVTLNLNNKELNRNGMTYEERQETLEAVVEFIKTLDIDIDVAIQHNIHWDTKRVNDTVLAFCEKYCAAKKQEPFQYGHEVGKIRKLNDGRFGFFKKGAKSKGYLIGMDDREILALAIRATA